MIGNNLGKLYAILFNADNNPHKEIYFTDLNFVYASLTSAGVDDITILEGGGSSSSFVHGAATVKNLTKAVDLVGNKIEEKDRLLIYLTNHGHLTNGLSKIETFNGELCETEYEKIIKDFPAKFVLSYFTSCHAGGLAERAGIGKNIGISIASKDEKSWGFPNYGNSFTRRLFPNLLGSKTIKESFDLAAILDMEKLKPSITGYVETPQLCFEMSDPPKLYLLK